MRRTKTQPSGQAANGAPTGEGGGINAVIDIAEAVKVSLRDCLAKTSELIAGLRRHKKTTKSVQSALASLRQLQSIDA